MTGAVRHGLPCSAPGRKPHCWPLCLHLLQLGTQPLTCSPGRGRGPESQPGCSPAAAVAGVVQLVSAYALGADVGLDPGAGAAAVDAHSACKAVGGPGAALRHPEWWCKLWPMKAGMQLMQARSSSCAYRRCSACHSCHCKRGAGSEARAVSKYYRQARGKGWRMLRLSPAVAAFKPRCQIINARCPCHSAAPPLPAAAGGGLPVVGVGQEVHAAVAAALLVDLASAGGDALALDAGAGGAHAAAHAAVLRGRRRGGGHGQAGREPAAPVALARQAKRGSLDDSQLAAAPEGDARVMLQVEGSPAHQQPVLWERTRGSVFTLTHLAGVPHSWGRPGGHLQPPPMHWKAAGGVGVGLGVGG